MRIYTAVSTLVRLTVVSFVAGFVVAVILLSAAGVPLDDLSLGAGSRPPAASDG